jgi:hypothetical protein
MMLVMTPVNTGTMVVQRPTLFCFDCAKQIDNWRQGRFLWIIDKDGNPINKEIMFYHEYCIKGFREKFPNTAYTAAGLSMFITDLAESIGIELDIDFERMRLSNGKVSENHPPGSDVQS